MSSPAMLLPLPEQSLSVAWPTLTWPEADVDRRVDRVALERLLDHAFQHPDPDDLDRTHAVVIVQGGAIVAERYAHDAAPEHAFLSWSMAKSITQSLIGILVAQGKLDIHAPIPVPEWSEGDPRRRITIDHLLRMVDGLRFREAEHLGGGSVRYYPEHESDVIPMLFGAGLGERLITGHTWTSHNRPTASPGRSVLTALDRSSASRWSSSCASSSVRT
jgi:CubicO group peptidase (beta-lactamase class C family)